MIDETLDLETRRAILERATKALPHYHSHWRYSLTRDARVYSQLTLTAPDGTRYRYPWHLFAVGVSPDAFDLRFSTAQRIIHRTKPKPVNYER